MRAFVGVVIAVCVGMSPSAFALPAVPASFYALSPATADGVSLPARDGAAGYYVIPAHRRMASSPMPQVVAGKSALPAPAVSGRAMAADEAALLRYIFYADAAGDRD